MIRSKCVDENQNDIRRIPIRIVDLLATGQERDQGYAQQRDPNIQYASFQIADARINYRPWFGPQMYDPRCLMTITVTGPSRTRLIPLGLLACSFVELRDVNYIEYAYAGKKAIMIRLTFLNVENSKPFDPVTKSIGG